MARRSLAKRILRSLQKFKKTSINKGRALEAAIARYTEELVGPEVTNHVKCCNEQGYVYSNVREFSILTILRVECACAKARELAWKTHVACIPYKITRFKTEFNTFRTKVKKFKKFKLTSSRLLHLETSLLVNSHHGH